MLPEAEISQTSPGRDGDRKGYGVFVVVLMINWRASCCFKEDETVVKECVSVWESVQSVNECRNIKNSFRLRALTALNVSIPDWRLHFSLSAYTEVTRLAAWKPLFMIPVSFCVSSLVPISPIPKLFHEQSLRGRDVTQTCTLLSPFFSLSFHLFKHSGERVLVRWKPLLGKGKKEIACEREW